MSLLRDKVIEIITPDLNAMGMDIVDVELAGNVGRTVIKLYIDRLGETESKCNVTIAECEKASRTVEKLLNVEELFPRDYILEVSTPGLERPLRTLNEYKRFTGKLAQITSDKVSGGVVVGRIKNVEDSSIVLDVEGKEQRLNIEQIKKAKLKFER